MQRERMETGFVTGSYASDETAGRKFPAGKVALPTDLPPG